MKIGSVAWGWTPTPEDLPAGDSLERIADNISELGFDLIDYLCDYASLDQFFTEQTARRVGGYCKSIGLAVGGLVFQSALWNQVEPSRKQRQLEYFRMCAQTANHLGAGTISCIVPGPLGARPNRMGSPSEKKALNLPADYSWQRDWDNYVAQMSAACDIAAEHGLSVALECFVGCLCATPHAMLQVLRDVDRANFGIQLDTAHLMNQSIDIETCIYMLGGRRIRNVHAKDSDGLTRTNLPCGAGRVDYTAVAAALNNVGYAGNISVEVEFTDNPGRYMRQALAHLRECLAGTY